MRVLQRAWLEAEMSWVELGGAGWSWVEVEMSWVEVDGAGWRWVHGLVIPVIFQVITWGSRDSKVMSNF